MSQRFDVFFDGDNASIDFHFCRDWDDTGGCYGTNQSHGFSFDEAKEHIAAHYRQLADYWTKLSYEEWFKPFAN